MWLVSQWGWTPPTTTTATLPPECLNCTINTPTYQVGLSQQPHLSWAWFSRASKFAKNVSFCPPGCDILSFMFWLSTKRDQKGSHPVASCSRQTRAHFSSKRVCAMLGPAALSRLFPCSTAVRQGALQPTFPADNFVPSTSSKKKPTGHLSLASSSAFFPSLRLLFFLCPSLFNHQDK